MAVSGSTDKASTPCMPLPGGTENARGAEDLSRVAVIAIKIELPVDHAAAGMNAGIGPGEIPLAIQRLAAIADDQRIAGLGHLERQPGALEPGARPVLSFINQYGVVATAQARLASQAGKQALAEGAVLLALAEIDAAATGPAMEGRHRHPAMAGQRHLQMLHEQSGVEAMYDPRNRPIVEAILVANASGMTPELAVKAYDIYVNDKTGFFRRPVFDAEGTKTVLALRSLA
jgi:hypothetical protein